MAATRPARRMNVPPRAGDRSVRPSAPVWIMGVLLFAFLIAVLGGSSRFDMMQVPILLPVACLAAGFGLIRSWDADWRALKIPLILLGAWTVWTLIQVVPLPPGLWQALPGREPMVQVAQAIGEERWHPLSMAPWRTHHALWALSVPLAALFLFAALRERAIGVTLQAAIAIAVASALLGVLQITLPSVDALYLYEITNRSDPVGLFANANHAAMLNAIMLVVIAATARLAPRPHAAWWMPALGAAYFILLVTQFINASRAGLGLTVAALLVSALIVMTSFEKRGGRRTRKGLAGLLASPQSRVALALLVGAIALAVLFFLSDRLPGFAQLLADSPLEDLRFEIAPILQQMAWTYFPFGTGFGSFETVFYIHEPAGMLAPSYVNQAHNDLLQMVIEGGLPALAIALGILVWLVRIAVSLWRSGIANRRVLAIAASGTVACIVLASAVDYPLRAPLFQVIAVWLLCAFATLARQPAFTDTGDAKS